MEWPILDIIKESKGVNYCVLHDPFYMEKNLKLRSLDILYNSLSY